MGRAEVKGGGAKGKTEAALELLVLVEGREICDSNGLLSVLALDNASLILVCTSDTSTYSSNQYHKSHYMYMDIYMHMYTFTLCMNVLSTMYMYLVIIS